MSMEKRGNTAERDIREFVKMADAEEKIFIVSLDGMVKYASGKPKAAVVVVATGDRASMLREFVEKVSD